MQKGNAFPFRAHARHFIDQPYPGVAAALESRIQVVYRKADMVDSWATPVNVLRDGRTGSGGLQKLHERLSRLAAAAATAIADPAGPLSG